MFELHEIQDTLDALLNQQSADTELSSFLEFLMSSYGEWRDRDACRIGRCVSRYMQDRFAGTLNQTMDQLLADWFGARDSDALADPIKTRVLTVLQTKAEPRFWQNPQCPMGREDVLSRSFLTYPGASASTAAAASGMEREDPCLRAIPCGIGDHITWLSAVMGLPLYAFQEVYRRKAA